MLGHDEDDNSSLLRLYISVACCRCTQHSTYLCVFSIIRFSSATNRIIPEVIDSSLDLRFQSLPTDPL